MRARRWCRARRIELECGDCGAQGRGYYLHERTPDAFHVFIYAPFEEKVARLERERKFRAQAMDLAQTGGLDRAFGLYQTELWCGMATQGRVPSDGEFNARRRCGGGTDFAGDGSYSFDNEALRQRARRTHATILESRRTCRYSIY